MCADCLHSPSLYSEACKYTEWCGRVRHYNLKAATPTRGQLVRPSTSIQTLEEFAASLGPQGSTLERVIPCVVHDDDNNELDEPFYLARVVSKARKLDKDCLVGGNDYRSGDFVVNIRWYLYLYSTRGDRVYRLQPGPKRGVVYSVKSLVKGLDGIKFKSYEGGKYTFGRESVKRLTHYMKAYK